MSHLGGAGGKTGTSWSDYVSRLAWEHLGVKPDELEKCNWSRGSQDVPAETAAPALGKAGEDGWVDVCKSSPNSNFITTHFEGILLVLLEF